MIKIFINIELAGNKEKFQLQEAVLEFFLLLSIPSIIALHVIFHYFLGIAPIRFAQKRL